MNKDGILVSFVISSDVHKFEKEIIGTKFVERLGVCFLFQHSMNSIYLPNGSKSSKTRARSYFCQVHC